MNARRTDDERPARFRDGHPEVERLSALLDGDLPPDTADIVRTHVEGCDACAGVLADLQLLCERAGALGPVEPPVDLWPGIAARLSEQPPARSAVGREASGSGERSPGSPRRRPAARWRLTLSAPQLAAAALVLTLASSVATWSFAARTSDPTGTSVATGAPAAPDGGLPVSTAARTFEPDAPSGMASELAELEDVLEAGRAVLDPATVLILERNLGVIDRAIEESVRALELDPGSEFLEDHLARAWARKLEYLRDVSRIVDLAG